MAKKLLKSCGGLYCHFPHCASSTSATFFYILQSQKKGIHMNTLERFYIYKEASVNDQLKDDHTILNSQIFETILKDFQGKSQ